MPTNSDHTLVKGQRKGGHRKFMGEQEKWVSQKDSKWNNRLHLMQQAHSDVTFCANIQLIVSEKSILITVTQGSALLSHLL